MTRLLDSSDLGLVLGALWPAFTAALSGGVSGVGGSFILRCSGGQGGGDLRSAGSGDFRRLSGDSELAGCGEGCAVFGGECELAGHGAVSFVGVEECLPCPFAGQDVARAGQKTVFDTV